MDTNISTLSQLYARFIELAERAEHETKQYGAPDGETQMHLDTLNSIFDAADRHAASERRAHNAFVRTLREGYHSADRRLVTLMVDHDPTWKTMPLASDGKETTDDSESSKAMTRADDTTGGYLASETFATNLLHALKETSPVRQVATVHLSGGTGEFLPIVNDVQTAVRVSESATRTPSVDADLDFKAANIPVHEAMAFTAISRHLVMDSQYPLEDALLRAARVAFAKLEGTEFIKGTGNGEFMGLNSLTLPTGNVITGSDTTGHKVSAVDIQKLLHETLGAQYLAGATLLLNKKTLGAIRQLNATSGAIPMFPLADRPGTLAGVPYVLCPDMDEAGAANRNAVYLLHPAGYTVAQRQDVAVLRLSERYADVGKFGYYIFIRSGGSATLTEAIAKIITA